MTCDGRLFHRRAAATGDALSLTVVRQVRRTSRDVDEAQHSRRLASESAARRSSSHGAISMLFVRCSCRFSLTNTEVRQLLDLMPKMLQQNPFTMLERDVLPQPDPHQCPYPVNVACTPHAPYRMYDGRCNNLLRPLWGSSHQPLARFLPPDYADGK